MMIIVSMLMIALIISITLLFLFLQDIKKINQQIDYKNQTGSHFEVAIQSSLPAVKQLQNKINALYATIDQTKETSLHKEKEMQTMMSGISHDIRTPLTSMRGYLRLLEQTNNELEKQKYLQTIDFRLESLQSILEDLFIHSKINDSDYQLTMEDIEIYPLVCKILASFYYDFEKKNVEPIITFSNEHLILHSNKELFTRMVQNIINNALKHGDNYFEIKEIDGTLIFVNNIKDQDNIDPKRLFDRFYKADLSRHNDSTGLGLSIVKNIVMLHNWKIEADLKENQLAIKINTK
ncbi:HAMP domain-containing sensor histidine kinase [Thomasclavelia sp.]|uniref:sensor histidine kinase n=1 Tax=Thomasclavelia sp. TaxID=3025757 RepID=UPI0025D19D22|nr:HAMP domain-containing sensor histidine kinase [Thomasclavelia sp.]